MPGVHSKFAGGFVPSDQWAIKKEMDPFVPQPSAAARASPDGHDPASQTSRYVTLFSAARAGTTVGPMSRFFTNSPDADTYDNAADKSAWREETCSGGWDSSRIHSSPVSAGAGSMCPVEYGGLHVGATEPVQDTFVAPAMEGKPVMSKEQQAEVLAAAGVLTRPDGSRYETETGFQLAQQRVLSAAMK